MDLHLDKQMLMEKWADFKETLSRTWHKISDTEGERSAPQDHVSGNRSMSAPYEEFIAGAETSRQSAILDDDKRRLDWESEDRASTPPGLIDEESHRH